MKLKDVQCEAHRRRRLSTMVAKDDKDGQIKLLREALEKIHAIAEEHSDRHYSNDYNDIERISSTALIDTTY